jgi:YD repeat-containing protein
MVAIVNGQGLGVNSYSAGVLGERALLSHAEAGRNGQKVYLNASNGNLVVQTQDERLFDHGLDLGVVRTYNSQGYLGDGAQGGVATGLYARRVVLDGNIGEDGSTITRTGKDGAERQFAWDSAAQRYVGDSAADGSLVRDGQQLVWRGGDDGVGEAYDAAGGPLRAVTDGAGNRIDYSYDDDGLLTGAVSDGGDAVYYDYAGGLLQAVRTVTHDEAGVERTQTRVRYGYDALDRLVSVTVDLSPADGDIADGNVYRTDYRYDGDSARMAAIGQSDGTALAFGYVYDEGDWRLASITTDSARDASGNYNVVNDDGRGNRSVNHFDAAGLLVQSLWERDDGSRGSKVLHADGSSVETTVSSSGWDGAQAITTTVTDDGAGNVVTQTLERGDLRRDWVSADGSSVRRGRFPGPPRRCVCVTARVTAPRLRLPAS